jgi:hypothetical protein
MSQVFTYFTIEQRNQNNGNWELIDRINISSPPNIKLEKRFLWFKWTEEVQDTFERNEKMQEGKIEAIKLAKIFAEKEKDIRVLHYKYELLDYGEFFEPTLKSTEIWKNGNWLT